MRARRRARLPCAIPCAARIPAAATDRGSSASSRRPRSAPPSSCRPRRQAQAHPAPAAMPQDPTDSGAAATARRSGARPSAGPWHPNRMAEGGPLYTRRPRGGEPAIADAARRRLAHETFGIGLGGRLALDHDHRPIQLGGAEVPVVLPIAGLHGANHALLCRVGLSLPIHPALLRHAAAQSNKAAYGDQAIWHGCTLSDEAGLSGQAGIVERTPPETQARRDTRAAPPRLCSAGLTCVAANRR